MAGHVPRTARELLKQMDGLRLGESLARQWIDPPMGDCDPEEEDCFPGFWIFIVVATLIILACITLCCLKIVCRRRCDD